MMNIKITDQIKFIFSLLPSTSKINLEKNFQEFLFVFLFHFSFYSTLLM